MAKVKISNKKAKELYDVIIQASDLKMLHYLDDRNIFYNSGVYGWNWDIYDFNGVALINSYRNTPCNIRPSYKIVEKYNKIFDNYLKKYQWTEGHSWTDTRKKAEKLLTKFIEEVRG